MTQLALIPPTPHLDLGITNMHLLLSHLCDEPEYVQYYRKRNLQGDYLILDNSAYERGTSQANMAMMMALGYYLQVDEIVAPDVIMNERATYALMLDSVSFLSSAVGQHAWLRAGRPRIMVTPQVDPKTQSIDSYDRHARLLMQIWHWQCPYLANYITLGVSKNMNRLTGGWLLLFREVVQELIKEYPIQVHALGLPKQLPPVRTVLKENPYIRSLDTALPFVSAIHDVSMQTVTKEFPKRPANYLERVMSEEQIQLAGQNIGFMMAYLVQPGQPVTATPRPVTPAEQRQFERT